MWDNKFLFFLNNVKSRQAKCKIMFNFTRQNYFENISQKSSKYCGFALSILKNLAFEETIQSNYTVKNYPPNLADFFKSLKNVGKIC